MNPSIQKCFCCGKEMGLVLFGASYTDENGKHTESPREVMTGDICEDCKNVINNGGTFFIEVRDGEAEKASKNPYRTGRLIAIKTEAALRMFNNCKAINFMEEAVFNTCFSSALMEDSSEE